MEPEVGLICELKYDGTKVIDLVPNYGYAGSRGCQDGYAAGG